MKLTTKDIVFISELRYEGVLWRHISSAFNGNTYQLIRAYNNQVKAG